jgi:hypothetical protein
MCTFRNRVADDHRADKLLVTHDVEQLVRGGRRRERADSKRVEEIGSESDHGLDRRRPSSRVLPDLHGTPPCEAEGNAGHDENREQDRTNDHWGPEVVAWSSQGPDRAKGGSRPWRHGVRFSVR